ncbi:MAG: aldo/keto reductase [Chloroflexi bacterium]|nr:aldo/keto reductase [Chloroflexota bacterium]
MQYNRLGTSGLQVSRFCIGTAFRSSLFSSNFDESGCVHTIHRALDLGVNFIDTANYYSYGRSEAVVGKAIVDRRDDIVLATKVFSQIKDNPGPNDHGLSRYHILREVDRSLQRLRTDHLDIYWLHGRDEATPIDETLRAMDDLVRSGKVRYIGACNFNAWQICEALWRSDALHTHAFACIQNQYSLLNRWEIEPELVPLSHKYGLGIVTYSPLAIGLLTGRFRRGQTPPAGTPWSDNAHYASLFDRMLDERNDAIVAALIDIGAAHSRTPSQVAVAWILEHPEISSVIMGPDTPAHVDDVLGAADWQLPTDARARLDELSAPIQPLKTA